MPSPCIQICRIDPLSGCCEGCQRRLEEIGAWSGLDDEGKRALWRRIRARRDSEGAKS